MPKITRSDDAVLPGPCRRRQDTLGLRREVENAPEHLPAAFGASVRSPHHARDRCSSRAAFPPRIAAFASSAISRESMLRNIDGMLPIWCG